MTTIARSALLVCVLMSNLAWAKDPGVQYLRDGIWNESDKNYDPVPVPQVSTNDVRDYLDDPTTLLVDRRGAYEYALGHVPGVPNVQGVDDVLALLTPDTVRVISMCSGPYCHASINLTNELRSDSAFTAAFDGEILRYQGGNPVWKVLSGEPMQIESAALPMIYKDDDTALFFYATPPDGTPRTTPLPQRAVELAASDVHAVVKDSSDDRLSRWQHNTRIVCFGESGDDAYTLAHALTQSAFVNVTFFDGTVDQFSDAVKDVN